MDIKTYKNFDEIKAATDQIRGEVFKQEDLDLIWLGGAESYILETYGTINTDTVELSVYDMDDNLLSWNVLREPPQIYNKNIVLSPGKSLRDLEFRRGQYRISYNLFRNMLGSSEGSKLYIEEISPSRKEVRVRPVKTASPERNIIFNGQVENFSDKGIEADQFKIFFNRQLNSLQAHEVIQDRSSYEYKLLENDILVLKKSTIKYLSNTLSKYHMKILNIGHQRRLISKAVTLAMTETFGVGWNKTAIAHVLIPFKAVLSTFVTVTDYSGNINYYLNFGNNNQAVVTNWVRDDIKYPDSPYSIVFKLYESLPKDIKEKQQLWISYLINRPVIEKVFMLGLENEIENGFIIRPANFDVNVGGMTGRDTGYQTWTDLVSTQPTTTEAVLDYYMSASDSGDIELNIDYSDYANFIHFGSAEERLKNFKYKLELIESYNANIATIESYTVSLYTSQSVAGFQTKIRQVKNGFDSYDRHLYYTSGSQYSGSLVSNETYLFNAINEWPKNNTKYPYTLYGTTASEATDWYANQLAITQRFDTDNIHNFRNNLPAYITTDENNEDYLNFTYMIGQHFDTTYTYIKQLTLTSNRDESLYEGLAKDLTYHVASSQGFDMFNGNDNADLWRWAFGYNEYGTYHTGSVSGSNEDWLPYSDVSKEIWLRILNNLPYILKTKGTERSIKALLACYGIPTSMMTIREYGGPDPRDYPDIQDKSAYIFEDFVYGADFEGSQSVDFTWGNISGSHIPYSTEIRFAAAPTTKPTQSIFGTTTWGVTLHNNQDGTGYLQIQDGSSAARTEDYRYFDNEFNSILVRMSGSDFDDVQLLTKKAEYDRIIWHSSASITGDITTGGTFYIGGNAAYTFGQQFTGSIQEFRCYYSALSESTWNNHVRWPKAYNANDPKRTYYDLILRYSFDDPKNHSSDTSVSDIKANQGFTTPGTAVNFDDWVNYTPRTEEFAALTPNIGGGRFIKNKIRLENNELIGDLSPRQRSELSSYDRAPNDSAKLGIYFSPLDAINKDIIATFAGIDLAGEMGDPRDRYEETYRDLVELQTEYWKKYTDRPQVNDFIRVIRQFDQSFFNQLRSLIPARAKPVIGVLIEPTILERDKIKWQAPSYERNDYEGDPINVEHQLTQSWDYIKYEGNLSFSYASSSEYILYEGLRDLGLWATSSYYVGEQQYIPMVKPIQDTQTGSFTIRQVYAYITSSIDAGGAVTYSRLSSRTLSNGTIIYHNYYDVYDLGQDNWLYEYRELRNDMWYGGTLNTLSTTVDGREPVEISYTNPNKLKATDTGPSKIRVE